MEKHTIEKRADRVLQAFGYQDGQDVYVDAVQLARFFGFHVEEKDNLPAADDGSVSVSKDGTERFIVVNDFRNIESKRFIIVHELAHYLLHYTGSQELFMHRENTKGKNEEENDADYLAACLLMPKESFYKQYQALNKAGLPVDLVLQQKFRTPIESIRRRVDEVCR